LFKIVASALRADPPDYRLVIETILDVVGHIIRADRLYLFSYDFNNDEAYVDYNWPAKDKSFSGQYGRIPLSELKSVLKLHLKGETVFSSRKFNSGKSKAGINGLGGGNSLTVLVPLCHQKGCLGFVDFERNAFESDYSAEEVKLLEAVGELITGLKLRWLEEEKNRELKDKFSKLVENATDWIWEIDEEGIFTYSNIQVENLTGYTRSEILGKSIYSFMKPQEARKVKTALTDAAKNRINLYQLQHEMINKSNHQIFFETSATPILESHDKVVGFRGISRDIIDRVLTNRRFDYMGMRDLLTGLYNRNYFEEEIKRLSHSRNYPIAIIYADVNGLKAVNDAFGHEKGDELLKEAARVLQSSLRSYEVLARIGGDEFAAVLLNIDKAEAENAASRIKNNVELYNRENRGVPLSLAVGVATAESSEQSFEEVLSTADELMYKDKICSRFKNHRLGYYSLPAAIVNDNIFGSDDYPRLLSICKALANNLGLSSRDMETLELLAKFHNLGKSNIPDKVLNKKTSLNDQEQKVIRLHPEKGYRLARTSNKLSAIAELILKHHERWDGKGYPLGLKGNEIPVECRVLAVADAFTAMTAGRPYKKSCSSEEAVQELKKCAGSQFDPRVVETFCLLIDEYGCIEAR